MVTGTSLVYAALDKLTTFHSGSSNATYRYAHNGLRRYSTDFGSPLVRRIYIMSGETLLGELKNGVPEIAYTWGPAGLISSRKLSGTPASRWYHFGPQGETRQLTGGSGNVTSTYRYSAYGVTLGTTGSDYNPFRYKGKFGYYTDIYTGMILAGQRWYQPVLARWTTRDPILFEGGYNLYQYVEGNPIRFVDPDGLEALTIGGGFGMVGAGSAGSGTAAVAGAAGAAGAAVGVAAGVGGAYVGIMGLICRWDPEGCGAAAEYYWNLPPNSCASGKGKKGERSKLPIKGGPPNGTLVDSKGGDRGTIRDYGPNGDAVRDYDFGGHENLGEPHAHDWNGTKRGPARPLKPGE